MAKYLDGTGLSYFWGKIKGYISNAISGKADKVSNSTEGNFASLDSSGNLVDSGHSHSDYLTSHQSLSNYVTLNGTQNISGEKTFVGSKRIKFKQSATSDKLGFTCYNNNGTEVGNFEADPPNRAINFGVYAPNSKPTTDWLVGFKYQAQDSTGTSHKYGLRIPTRFGNSTYAEHYIPISINNKEADNTGVITLSASDVGALPSTTVIPTEVTESTVSGWGFTKNTGTYSKPSGGIPASDLSSDVQTSLGKADTALQSYTETEPIFVNSVAHDITVENIDYWNNKQGIIIDLDSIRSGAALGATALQDTDVYDWAKAATKPSYEAGEIIGLIGNYYSD